MSFSMRLRTMLGCFQRPLIMRSKYSSASWPTVVTLRAASMRARAVDLRSCFSPATSWPRAILARSSLADWRAAASGRSV
jgi:hypothetical protein